MQEKTADRTKICGLQSGVDIVMVRDLVFWDTIPRKNRWKCSNAQAWLLHSPGEWCLEKQKGNYLIIQLYMKVNYTLH